MTIVKRIGLGCTLSCDPTGGTTYAALGAVVGGFDGPGATAKDANTALLSEVYETFARASIDPGELTFTIYYSPEDTATTTILTGLLTSGAIANWEVTLPALGTATAQNEHFLGYVKGISRKIEKDAGIMATITIKVSGTPGFTGA